MSPIEIALEELQASAYYLAVTAECATPDTPGSPGAEMLTGVLEATQQGLAYALTDLLEDEDPDMDEIRPLVATWLDEGGHEVADGAPSIYTYEMWKQFVDLAAWTEDPSDLGSMEDMGMERSAGVCLFLIADRLVHRLVDTFLETVEERLDDALVAQHEEGLAT